jgi:carbon-monoxide dehydrogenase medium subunit
MTALAEAPALAVHRSRKLIPDFRLHRPRTAAEAVSMKAACGVGAVFMAGGIDIVNRMKFGVPVSDVIHLGGAAGLDRIEAASGELRLGALVTHDRLANSPEIRSLLPALAQAWPDVANIRVRCKGTIGGNIMAADPAYDFALAALAADARLVFLDPDGGPLVVTAAELSGARPDRLLTTIILPTATTLRLSFDRSLRPIISLVLGLDVADGRITGGRVAIGCAYATPIAARLPIDEALAAGELASSAAAIAREVAAGLPEPLGDHHAGANYRRRMVEVLLRRNLSAVE